MKKIRIKLCEKALHYILNGLQELDSFGVLNLTHKFKFDPNFSAKVFNEFNNLIKDFDKKAKEWD
jgi:hypothetical protein